MVVRHSRWVTGLLVALIAAAGPPATDSYVHVPTGFVFPMQLGPLARANVETFEPRDLGIAVRYQSPTVKVDLFVYHLGQKNLPDGPNSPLVRRELKQVLDDVQSLAQQGHYQGLGRVTESKARLGDATGGVDLAAATFGFTQGGVARSSRVYLTALRGHFVKVRCTYNKPAGDETGGEQAADAFLAELAKVLTAPRPAAPSPAPR